MQEICNKAPQASGSVLSRCLVEGDEAALARARRQRRKALLVSVGLQVILLAALVLLPLLATGERLVARRDFTPIAPWYGSPHASRHPGSQASHRNPTGKPPLIYRPVKIPIPKDLRTPNGDVVRDDSRVPDDELGPGIPEGVIPPVGTADPRGFIAPPVPAQPPAEKDKRLIRSSDLQEALLIHRVLPEYPPLARQIHLEGTVRLRAIIGRDGVIDSLELLSGHPILARAALDAVSQWRYRPTLLGGEPVEVETIITVVFTLQQ